MPGTPNQDTKTTPGTRTRAVPDEGPLDRIGVAQLLAAAWRARRSGRLRLARGKSERMILVHEGSPIGVESKNEPDALARALESTGQIQAADRRRLEQFASERECSQASAALALKLVDATALYQAIRTTTRDQIAETFEWQTGMYQWNPLDSAPPANAKPYDVLHLIQTQLPKRWGTERLLAAVMAISTRQGDVAPRLRRVAQRLAEAGPMAAKVVGRLDGSVPLGRVLGEAAGDPLAAATLWTLWHAGILREGEASAAPAANEVLEFELDVVAAPNAAGVADPALAGPGAGDRTGAVDPEAQALRADIERLAAELGKLDHYAVLGLDGDANPAAIKKAYFKAAKRYHPDSLARKGLAGLEEKAARVFGRVSEAFEILTDPDKKAAYDRGASSEPEIDTARLAQAETSFRKGEILIKMGNFQGALEYLQSAVDLWPDEPAYRSALGWALYKQPSSNAPAAREQLELAHRQAPQDAVTMFRYGMVLRAAGEHETANELIARARSLESSLNG
ncbi:DnaJ domain-containing protein [Myxococcota bacterium]|nr:DnaJ domain-containing protein [Myxococcota bacterium]